MIFMVVRTKKIYTSILRAKENKTSKPVTVFFQYLFIIMVSFIQR
jgi:hypothetical protein